MIAPMELSHCIAAIVAGVTGTLLTLGLLLTGRNGG